MAARETSNEWSRRHLLVVLAVVAATAILLVVGLAYAVFAAIGTDASPQKASVANKRWPTNGEGIRGDEYRDAVAAEPMLKVSEEDMKPSAPALDRPGRMMIGPSTKLGPADIPAGFAHTPDGAVAQLAAIDIAALTPMSLEYARDIFKSWALDGGNFAKWEIAQSIQVFHQNAGTIDGDGAVSVSATPVGAQVKGTDGPDWVLACVQLDVTTIVVEQTRFGYGHCERMQWSKDRWMIAAGEPPSPAPSTWPASQRSLDAGWRLWLDMEDH